MSNTRFSNLYIDMNILRRYSLTKLHYDALKTFF
jgi:hypothetical protein